MKEKLFCANTKLILLLILIVFSWTSSVLSSEEYGLVAEWGGFGFGDGQFNGPSGIALDSEDNVYVADPKNCRIQKFNSDGEFITKWGNCGTGPEDFFMPYDLTIDNDDNVYVLNSWVIKIQDIVVQRFCNIQKFTSDGEFITKWGSWGTGDDQFLMFAGIATDSQGNVFVADWNMDLLIYFFTTRLQKFTSDGDFIWKWESSGEISELEFFPSPFGQALAVDDEDNLYILSLSPFPPSIHKLTVNGEPISEWSYFNFDEDLPLSSGMTTDQGENVYVVWPYPAYVKKFTSEGELLTKFDLTLILPIGQFSIRPMALRIAVDSGNCVYTIHILNNTIQKYAKNGQNGQPCFIEELYGEHSKKTELMRYFRDDILSKTPKGQELIRLYYAMSPVIGKAIEEDEEFKQEMKKMIDGVLMLIGGER